VLCSHPLPSSPLTPSFVFANKAFSKKAVISLCGYSQSTAIIQHFGTAFPGNTNKLKTGRLHGRFLKGSLDVFVTHTLFQLKGESEFLGKGGGVGKRKGEGNGSENVLPVFLPLCPE